MIRDLVHKYFNLKTLRCLCVVMFVLFLTACEKDDDSSLGGEGNYAEQANCWQAKIIEIVLSQINNMFSDASGKVANGGSTIVMFGFAIWMAFRMLKILPSFKEENLGEIWTEIGQKLFLCAFCAWCVSDSGMISWTLKTFVVPIYNAILELGAQILGQVKPSKTITLGDFGDSQAEARALMQQAKVILADEPIASLDPESARIVMDTLRDINQNDGITVVVTLHQVDYALRYCERIVALRQGHVFYDGSSQQFDNERFDHLYRSINRVEENAKAA